MTLGPVHPQSKKSGHSWEFLEQNTIKCQISSREISYKIRDNIEKLVSYSRNVKLRLE